MPKTKRKPLSPEAETQAIVADIGRILETAPPSVVRLTVLAVNRLEREELIGLIENAPAIVVRIALAATRKILAFHDATPDNDVDDETAAIVGPLIGLIHDRAQVPVARAAIATTHRGNHLPNTRRNTK